MFDVEGLTTKGLGRFSLFRFFSSSLEVIAIGIVSIGILESYSLVGSGILIKACACVHAPNVRTS